MLTINEIIRATSGKLICGSGDAGVSGFSIDSRTIKSGEAFVAIKGNNFDGHDFIDEAIKKGISCIIRQPKAARQQLPAAIIIEVTDTTKALGDIARFQRQKLDIPVIAVTGSNGKTTTKEMIAWVLSARFNVLKNPGTKNNHIGLPMTLLGLEPTHDIAVLEIGTNHPGEVEYLAKIALPNICVITNIGPSHLEYFKNLGGVYKEKSSLLDSLKDPAIALLNNDDTFLMKRIAQAARFDNFFGFGVKAGTDWRATKIKNASGRLSFAINKQDLCSIDTLGYLNIYNALVAAACGRIFGMEYKDIAQRLATFSFPDNRLTLFQLRNIKFINDTYNSNPVSLKQALDVLDSYRIKGRKIFVMGDMMELGLQRKFYHCQAGQRVAQVCDAFISVGKLSRLAAAAAKSSGSKPMNIFTCETSVEARDILFTKIKPGVDDVVLVKGSRSMKMEEVFKI